MLGRRPLPANDDGRLLIAGNWKMNKTYTQAVNLAQEISDRARREWASVADVVLIPPFTALRGVSNVIAFDRSFLRVGAQDCSPHQQGAFTGQISVDMLTDLDCAYCIVGHSERRGLLGETDADVAAKAAALEEAGVTPIVCVGEDREVYDRGATVEHVVAQVAGSLGGVDVSTGGIAVAYEPIWAIGTGMVAAPDHAQRVARAIRERLASMYGDQQARRARVLYGGSVKPGNVAAFIACPDIDGALVGGASLKADDFCSIVTNACDAARA
jgi:triosephosphate isomerase